MAYCFEVLSCNDDSRKYMVNSNIDCRIYLDHYNVYNWF